MTDYTKLIERLRAGIAATNDAATAIEALQGENERLDHDTADLAMLADQYKAERDALQANLDELQRQEPVGRFVSDDDCGHIDLVPHQGQPMVDGQAVYAAPKALEPTILKPLTPCVCHDETAKRYCKDKGKCTYFEAHGITKGTPT